MDKPIGKKPVKSLYTSTSTTQAGKQPVSVGTTPPKRSSVDQGIENLKDNRGIGQRLLGGYSSKAQEHIENIEKIKKFFKIIGVELPIDVQKVFAKGEYITEIQANHLKKLASEGEMKRPVNYRPFVSKDLALAMLDTVTEPDRISLSSVNTSFRKLLGDPQDRLRVLLTTEDLVPGSEKLQFALDNEYMVSITYSFSEDARSALSAYNQFVLFLEENPKLFSKIEILNLDHLEVLAGFKFQELLDSCTSLKAIKLALIKDQTLNFPETLVSFSCIGMMFVDLQFSDNLESFHSQCIFQNVALGLPANLKSFSCDRAENPVVFRYPESTPLVPLNLTGHLIQVPEGLTSLSYGESLGGPNANLVLPKSLKFLSCMYIAGTFTLTTSSGSPLQLKSLRCEIVARDVDTALPESIEEFDCTVIGDGVRLVFSSKLLKFSSSETIGENVRIALPSSLLSFSCGSVLGDGTFDFPEGYPRLESISHGEIKGEINQSTMQTLEENRQ